MGLYYDSIGALIRGEALIRGFTVFTKIYFSRTIGLNTSHDAINVQFSSNIPLKLNREDRNRQF